MPCPNCGSTSRHLERTAEDHVTMHSSLGLKHVRGETGRVAQEQVVGDAQSADGSWVDKAVIRDHEKDLYREVIVYGDGTKTVNEEPLSEYRGHGSDKSELRDSREQAARERREAHRARKELNDRVRQEFITGAEEEWRRRTGRPMTKEELERVLRRYPGDV